MAMWVYWLCCGRSSLSARRAWIEILAAGRKAVEKGSLSARRAWIEILHIEYCVICIRSLSARRAWIEIEFKASSLCSAAVALRKESVDRNISQPMRGKTDEGRSPQGEHGIFLFLTVQGGFVHANIRFNFENCYSKNSRIK